jgi:L-threonylcarbamoyladenylate synthase
VGLTATDAARLEECLTGDGVAVIPTDTVYGVACNPGSEEAVRRIYELKRRPPVKPSAVMFFALAPALQALPDMGPRTRAALAALLPGPVTVLLPNPAYRYPLACGPVGEAANAGESPPLGLRVPALSAGPLAVFANVRTPALQSSANFSGEPDPRRLQDVPVQLREGADLALDGGELPGIASTVLDLSDYERSGQWRVVRAGPIEETEIKQILGSC